MTANRRAPDAMIQAAAMMAARLRIMAKTQTQAREQGRDLVELHVQELFEAGDRAALEAYEAALSQMTGAVPLPFEGVA